MLYVVQAGDGGPCKIGITDFPIRRLTKMQSDHHETLRLLGTFEGGDIEEAALHQRFAASQIRGEWFRPHPDIVACNFGLPRIEIQGRKTRRRKFAGSPLGRYLVENDITLITFAGLMGVNHSTVSRWAHGTDFPRPRHLRAIERVTCGAITAADFLGSKQPTKSVVTSADFLVDQPQPKRRNGAEPPASPSVAT